ncbi:hypothetical protein BHE74_00032137, partial [Ensete ventricosum]
MSNIHKCAGAVEMRWVDTYFPFTNPSFELEIYFQLYDLYLYDLTSLEQFSDGKLGVKFKPFSKILMPTKLAIELKIMWLQVKLIDNFTNKKGITSHCYRITFRSMERSLTDDEINHLQ